MSFIAAAVIGAIGVGAGALISSSAAKSVGKQAQATATENNTLARDIYNQNATRLDPFANSGQHAGEYIDSLLGLDSSPEGHAAADAAFQRYLNSTGYKFALEQGTRAATNSAAAGGHVQSGATLKALDQYGQGLASQRFGGFLGELSNVRNSGVSAASALAGVGQNYVNQVSGNNNQALDAAGNATLTAAGNTSSAIGQLAQITAGQLGQSSYKPTASVAQSPVFGGHEASHLYGG